MKRRLFENLGWKLLALALAGFLWFSLSGQRRQRISERGYVIPLTVVNVPANMVIASPVPDTVDVRLRGPFDAIRIADPAKMEAVMDFSDAPGGERIYKLGGDDINAPEDLEVVSISPPTVRVRLERLAQKQVRIAARFSGGDASRFAARVDPPSARIAGPESEVARTDAVPTDPISLAGRSGDFTASATLAAEPNIRILEPKGVVAVHVRWKSGP
ncbi:MAG TPA: CdaR family protein [Thermoanaerobaculia bacterium]|nr:CdaR family protein [Thermoanaerobaculia bacterium]